MPDPATITAMPLGTVITYIAYWSLGWTIVNALLPPRELFSDFPGFQRWYNILLVLVAYWGALNVRKLTVDLYGKMGVQVAPAEHEKAKDDK